MHFKQLFTYMLLACYCFASSILVHNTAMHHLHTDDHHESDIIESVIQDNCCEENDQSQDQGCFKKCMGEYTKIFTSKINLQQLKYILALQYFPSLLLPDSTQQEVSLGSSYTIDPPNIFLSHYIKITKNILYA